MERKKIEMRREGNRLIIGDSPQLIVNLDSQENHLLVEGKLRPYYREVAFSQDLL